MFRYDLGAIDELTVNEKTDVITKDYIGWAIENGFQVIDVNIPKVVSLEDVGLCYFSPYFYFFLNLV